MTDWRTIVGNSETLSAADLEGKPTTAKIESVTGAKFEEDVETGAPKKTDKKALIAFVGKGKKFAANTINCLLIEQMWGKDFEEWVGHWLTIMPDKVEVRGKFYGEPCIRVKGSPELLNGLAVEIKLPRRKPFKRQLTVTPRNGSGADSEANRNPPVDAEAQEGGDFDDAAAFGDEPDWVKDDPRKTKDAQDALL